MGFFDSIFGSGETETKVSTQLPKWVEKAGQNNYGLAQKVASRPYQPYQFSRIAGMTPDQLSAQSMLRNTVPKEARAGYEGYKAPRMIDNIPGAEGAPGGSIKDYMNPYIDNVLNRTQQRIREATDYAKQWQSGVAGHQEGAFGDARHGVADAEIEKGGIREMGDTAAAGYAAAYDNAQGYRSADIDRLFNSEKFNREGNDEVLKYIDSLYRSGANTQQLNQQNQTMMYQDFLKQQDYPKEQLSILMQALGMSPYGKTQTSTEPAPSLASSILGTAANAYGASQGG